LRAHRTLACLLVLPVLLLVGNVEADEVETDESRNLSVQQMERLVHEVTAAQNKATTRGATLDDVERLYAMYTADFVYEHPGMDDVYTREHLYGNHTRAMGQGQYEKYDPAEHGYRVVDVMSGDNAAAVRRTQARLGDAPPRMAVFEFEGGKVARIREYWNY
jgi:ketosteroid isomerase-like protein